MVFTTTIDTADLARHLHNEDWAVVDCRFSLTDTERGRVDYLKDHIPGSIYAHLDEHLCGKIIPGKTGRHPLPEVDSLVNTLSGWGIDESVQVIAYDNSGGALAAARLWWLLRWLGHSAVAVLDGGWYQWLEDNRPSHHGAEHRQRRVFTAKLHPQLCVEAEDILRMSADSSSLVLDSRTADRYRGENETIDPVAGHIPGSRSAPYPDNLNANGSFLPPGQLRQRFRALLGYVPAENTAFYCGSGVTAAHNILALAHAGLGDAKLYAGSWSDWINDPNHPIATGA